LDFKRPEPLWNDWVVRKAPDEELVAVVETDACGAIYSSDDWMHFWQGKLVFRNYGKHAFTLADRKKGKGTRVCVWPDALKMDPESLSLSKKVQKDEASQRNKTVQALQRKRTQKILEAPLSLYQG